MAQEYTLENFRRDLTRYLQQIGENDDVQLAAARQILSVIEAIPPVERESGSPFLTPSLRNQIALSCNVSAKDFDEMLVEYKRLAFVIAELKRRGGEETENGSESV